MHHHKQRWIFMYNEFYRKNRTQISWLLVERWLYCAVLQVLSLGSNALSMMPPKISAHYKDSSASHDNRLKDRISQESCAILSTFLWTCRRIIFKVSMPSFRTKEIFLNTSLSEPRKAISLPIWQKPWNTSDRFLAKPRIYQAGVCRHEIGLSILMACGMWQYQPKGIEIKRGNARICGMKVTSNWSQRWIPLACPLSEITSQITEKSPRHRSTLSITITIHWLAIKNLADFDT